MNIFEAIERGDLENFKNIISRSRHSVNTRDNSQSTPLHIAAQYGQTEMAELLVKNGADTTARDNSQNTPLHIAAKYSQGKIAELLVKNGVNVNALNKEKKSPLSCTFEAYNDTGIPQLLISHGGRLNGGNVSEGTSFFIDSLATVPNKKNNTLSKNQMVSSSTTTIQNKKGRKL